MILRYFINPGLSLLPATMDNFDARVLLVAIGLQESRFEHRFQIQGPARGFWQFEEYGGVRGVLNHPDVSDIVRHVCRRLKVEPSTTKCYEAIAYNDTLACVFARLLLWTVPRPLPRKGQVREAWKYYLDGWRPGKPHPETWEELHGQAIKIVERG
jgi:hypothetical protein